jgi:hypothetical protein
MSAAFALEFSGPPVPCDFPGCTLDAFHEGEHVRGPKKDHFEAFRPKREMSEIAARAVAAGVPVKIRKGVEYLYVNDATYEYLTGNHAAYLAPLLCSCAQRPYPHELSVHKKAYEAPGGYMLYEDVRVQFASGEMRWPWSLRFAPNMEAPR